MPVLVEVCIDSAESAASAIRGGARRLELCAALHDGGTTPSAGAIAATRALGAIALHVLIRPRGGDFVYTVAELDVMRRDIEVARSLGADGFATGALRESGVIDEAATRALVGWAAPLPVVFHRAFDATPDAVHALETLVTCGVRGVLTSGGAASALEGVDTLAALVRQGSARITIMAGGGIREHNVAEIVQRSGVTEVHTRPDLVRRGHVGAREVPLRRVFPPGAYDWEETDESRVRAVVSAVAEGGTAGNADTSGH